MSDGDQVNFLLQAYQATARHKKKVLIWSGLAVGLSIAALFTLPRKYASDAKLFVRLGRENVTLDPTATTGATLQIQESRENHINSTRDMLMSRSLMEEVVKKVGASSILTGPAEPVATSAPGLVARARTWVTSIPMPSLSKVSDEERAVMKLSKSIGIKAGRNSSVIDVSFTAANPKLAQQILNVFLDAYQDQHMTANRTAGAMRFFAAQTAELKKQLDDTLKSLENAKNESGLVSVAAEQRALQDQLLQTKSASFAANAGLSASEASIERLQKAITDLPERVNAQETAGFSNLAADNMRNELFKLQMSLRELEAKLGPEHPVVFAVREQVKQSEAIVNKQPGDRVQTTTAVNPGRQALDLDLRREMVAAAGLRAKTMALNEQLATLQQRTRDLNASEVKIAQIERQSEIAAANYRNYVDRLEQVRIGEALEAQKISNINVVQAPSFIEKPVGPNSWFILALGFATALCGSAAIVFTCETFDKAFRNVEEPDGPISRPAFGTIPPGDFAGDQFEHNPSWATASQA